MNLYLIPANTKKSNLILGILRPFPDLIILIIGVIATFIGLIITQGQQDASTLVLAVVCLPGIISIGLVLPLPYYHNVLGLIMSVYEYYFVSQKNYIWKGWCIYNEFK